MNAENHVNVIVGAASGVLTVTIEDHRAHVLEAFEQSEGRETELATAAWTVGTAAMHQAFGLASHARLDEVGRDILAGVDEQLSQWTETTTMHLTQVLMKYFDPTDGDLASRLERFVADDGELSAMLQSSLAPQQSLLATTLAEKVGEHSPVFKLLDPDHADGVVRQLEKRLEDALRSTSLSFSSALDPGVPTSPLGRFLTDLRVELKRTTEDRDAQLKLIASQLDAGDANSLLSQLVARTTQAQQQLQQAINPAQPGSPLAVVRDSLVKLLTDAAEEQRRMAVESRTSQQAFQARVIEFLSEARARQNERDRGPRGGRDFEEALTEFVASAVGTAPVVCDPCGTRTGALPGRKTGDVVLRFTQESAYAGAAVVIEAKRDASYSMARILEEAQRARQNRRSNACVFVLCAERAGPGIPAFSRHGRDVVVRWTPECPDHDAYLHAALHLGLALAASEATAADPRDLEALGELEDRIGRELRRLALMEKQCDTIERAAAKVRHETVVGRKKLGVMLERSQAAMRAVGHRRPEVGAAGNVEPITLTGDVVAEPVEGAAK